MTGVVSGVGAVELVPELVVVCRFDDLPRGGGVTALVHGQAVAIFRTWDGNVYATCNRDPWTGTSVLARGIVGTRGEVPVVASPMLKQAFDLRTGICLDDPSVRVPVHHVRVLDGMVCVGRRIPPAASD